MAVEDVKKDRNVKKGVMIKMEEEMIKVAATATICAAPRNHLCAIIPTAEKDTRDDAQDGWVFWMIKIKIIKIGCRYWKRNYFNWWVPHDAMPTRTVYQTNPKLEDRIEWRIANVCCVGQPWCGRLQQWHRNQSWTSQRILKTCTISDATDEKSVSNTVW